MAIRGIPSTVLIAPDAFKGTLAAGDVAAAIARGLEHAGRAVELCPVADGGEGTLAVRAPARGAELCAVTVSDPVGRPVRARFGIAGKTAIVELAAASGLQLVSGRERDPVRASSFGTGQLVAAAIEGGAETVLIGAGGSATTDGGAGAIRALRCARGARLGAKLIVLCDVRTPFEDAARVFAPQKGAAPRQIRGLTRRLAALACRLPRDPRGIPMTGAAGGLSGGLWAEFGAELVPGAAFVLDAVGFDRRMRAARAVVAGEGRLDRQSLAGKALSEVAIRARQAGVPCHAIVGSNALDRFGLRVLDLQVVLEAGSPAKLVAAGRELAARL
jgi:glycerate kinase